MQSKWILQTFLRIFSSQQYDECFASLQAFLPKNMVNFSDVVLSPKLATTVQMLHFITHYTSSSTDGHTLCCSTCPDLESVLASVSANLTSKTLQQYHRPITRFSTLTMFKRFLNEGHKVIVSMKIDAEATAKADEVDKLIAVLQAKELSWPNSMESFKIEKLLEVVKDSGD